MARSSTDTAPSLRDTQPFPPLPATDADVSTSARRNPAQIRTVVVYLRTANAGADGRHILQRQRAELQGEIDFQGWRVIAWIEDLHRSGTTTDRPGLRQALNLLDSGYVDALICCDITRLTTSAEVTRQLAGHMDQYRWDLITLQTGSEPITLDPAGPAAPNPRPQPA